MVVFRLEQYLEQVLMLQAEQLGIGSHHLLCRQIIREWIKENVPEQDVQRIQDRLRGLKREPSPQQSLLDQLDQAENDF